MTAPHLLETMRAEGGRVALLDLHLARLQTSAARLGYPLDVEAVRQRLATALARAEPLAGLRLTLSPTGDVSVCRWPLDDIPFRTAAIDLRPWHEAGSPLCVHKTTARDLYRTRHQWAQSVGADEAVLVAPDGTVVEGTRTNVWAEVGGRLWTPPLEAGGLPGVMRAHVLATVPRAGEQAFSVDDLRTADAVYLSNALRGWMPVRLLDPGPDDLNGAPADSLF